MILDLVDTLTLTATAGRLTGTSNRITVNPGAPASIVLNAPSAVEAGVPFPITVNVFDAYGNRNPCNGVVKLGIEGRTFDLTLNKGTASTTVTLIHAGKTTLDCTLGNIQKSIQLTVNPGPAINFEFSFPPDYRATAGSSLMVSVRAMDVYRNTATSFNGIVTITSSDNEALGSDSVVLRNGIGSISLPAIHSDLWLNISGVTLEASVRNASGTTLYYNLGHFTVEPRYFVYSFWVGLYSEGDSVWSEVFPCEEPNDLNDDLNALNKAYSEGNNWSNWFESNGSSDILISII
jgi:hypothetical protein